VNLILKYVFLLSFCLVVSSCSSSSEEEGTSKEFEGGHQVKGQDYMRDKYGINLQDVQQGEGDEIVGGKRSRYDERVSSAFAKGASKSPDYLKSRYHQKAWSGNKDYSKGSFKTDSWSGTKTSRFANQSSRDSQKTARANDQDYSTGSYRTGGATEAGTSHVSSQQSHYGQKRWERNLQIFDYDDYRKMSLDQTKSLLGKD